MLSLALAQQSARPGPLPAGLPVNAAHVPRRSQREEPDPAEHLQQTQQPVESLSTAADSGEPAGGAAILAAATSEAPLLLPNPAEAPEQLPAEQAAPAAVKGVADPDDGDAGTSSTAPLRRRSGRIAARQSLHGGAAMQPDDAAGPSRQATDQAPLISGAAPPEQPPPPPQRPTDRHGAAALRLAYAMSVLLFTALFLPVIAPRASDHTSKVYIVKISVVVVAVMRCCSCGAAHKCLCGPSRLLTSSSPVNPCGVHMQVLLTAVLGAMTLAVVFAPVLKKPAGRLMPAFKADDWETSFLFHDSSASFCSVPLGCNLCSVMNQLDLCTHNLCWPPLRLLNGERQSAGW